MEEYKAQYYNEMLQHFGVKGMKWGVRRKRAANYAKQGGKAIYNKYRHPIRSKIARAELNRNTRFKTIARRNLPLYSGQELAKINENVRQQNKAMKNKPKTQQKMRKVRPAHYAYESARLGVNRLAHPIRTGIASASQSKNKRMKTLLRRKLALSSYEKADINRDVREQNTYARKAKAKRNMKKYNKTINRQIRVIRKIKKMKNKK